MIINVTATGYITLSSPNRNTDFLENPLVAFDIIGVFTMLDNPNCMFVKWENASEDFCKFFLHGRILQKVRWVFNCLKRRFCAEFWTPICNILCRIVHLEELKNTSAFFIHGHTMSDCLSSVRDTKLKLQAGFKKI